MKLENSIIEAIIEEVSLIKGEHPNLEKWMTLPFEKWQDWESFDFLQLVVGLEERYEVKFHSSAIEKFSSVADISEAIRSQMKDQ